MESPEKEFYSLAELYDFTRKNYFDLKQNDAKSSLNPFWNNYIGIESQISFFDLKQHVDYCLNDLTLDSTSNKNDLLELMQLTPQRTKDYMCIDEMLKSEGVKEADRIVTLDAHDFACNSSETIDFVTFDWVCYNGAKAVETLCFNSIKGKYDFNAS